MNLKFHEGKRHQLEYCLLDLLRNNKIIKSDFSNLAKIASIYKLLLHFMCKGYILCTDFVIASEKPFSKIKYKCYLIENTNIYIDFYHNVYEQNNVVLERVWGTVINGYRNAPFKNLKIVTIDYLIKLIDRLAKIHSINFQK